MSFLSTACDKLVRFFSLAGCATVLLVLVLSCVCPTQQKQVSPAAEVKKSERDETLPSVKPVTPPATPESKASSKQTTSQEIEVHNNSQIDTVPIEKE
jgi:hypothetical protein